MKFKYATHLIFIFFVAVIITSCATSEQTVDPEEDTIELEPLTEERSTKKLQVILASTRNSLSDIYYTQTHDMPQTFLKKDTVSHAPQNPFDGYRVQILSTRDMVRADSVTGQFRLWADTTLAGYMPNAYVSFKQPFYKVHVGDFLDQSRANELSRIIKRKYPEAWVVHDRIDPNEVPADTIQIRLAENKKEAKNEEID